jgi:hypothetical protein
MCDMDRKVPCFSSYHKDKVAHTSNYQSGTFASAAIALEKLKLWDQLVSQTFHDVFNTNRHLLLHEKQEWDYLRLTIDDWNTFCREWSL